MDLDTTNILLGILAAVSAIELLALIAGGVIAYRLYTKAMGTLHELEERHVAPIAARAAAVMTQATTVMTKVDSLLIDVKDLTSRAHDQPTSRVGNLIAAGARHVIGGFFNGRRSSGEAPEYTAHTEAGTT